MICKKFYEKMLAADGITLSHDILATGLGISGYGTKKEEVKQDKRAMKGARSLGRQVMQLIKTISARNKSSKRRVDIER